MRKPKIGGKETLSILITGNTDLTDSLLSVADGGGQLDRGLKSLVEEQFEGKFKVVTARRPGFRSDILLQQLGERALPEGLRTAGLDQDPFITAQFKHPSSPEPIDVLALSVEPDVTQNAWQHREQGYVLTPPPDWEQAWTAGQKQWLRETLTPLGKISVEGFKQNLIQLVQAVKEKLDAHVLAYNCCTVDPDDHTYSYFGKEDDTLAVRVQRFNRALIEVSVEEGISIIDADRLISELGARDHVVKGLHYSAQGCKTLCKEFLRVLADIGFFEKRPLVMQVGRPGK